MAVAPARRATTAAFVRRALALLRSQQPAAYHRMVDALRPGAVLLEVDGERFAVEARGDGAWTGRRATRPATGRVTARDGVVLDLIDGRLDLLGAVEAGRLDVRGDPEAVLRLARALSAFVEGAVRAPGLRDLLDEYRAAVRAGA
ncbi:MAG: SCP2 sterol-binding domain-containing protein [Thermoleophilia bacterium]